jgi:hypothetical protein
VTIIIKTAAADPGTTGGSGGSRGAEGGRQASQSHNDHYYHKRPEAAAVDTGGGRDTEKMRETEIDREAERQRDTTADTSRGIEAPPRGGQRQKLQKTERHEHASGRLATHTSEPV